MLDDYNYFVTPKGNKIWACAMSLAWNELKKSFLSGKNAEFKDTNELQNKIVSNLNSELFTRD
jgi:DNA-binding MarR family transcriptional regulator